MAQLPNSFNAHNVDPAAPVQALPVSDAMGHPVIISASEFKAAKSGGQNGYLELMLTIIDGQHKGESGAYRLNLFNDNPQTVDIASKQLSAVCHVTGQMMISDSQQLHNIPFRVIVGQQKKIDPSGPDYTEVKGVLHINGEKPKSNSGTGNAPQGAPAPQPPAQAAPAPWQGAAPAPSPAPWNPGAAASQAQPAGNKPPWAQ